jgi:hypothetical protein
MEQIDHHAEIEVLSHGPIETGQLALVRVPETAINNRAEVWWNGLYWTVISNFSLPEYPLSKLSLYPADVEDEFLEAFAEYADEQPWLAVSRRKDWSIFLLFFS